MDTDDTPRPDEPEFVGLSKTPDGTLPVRVPDVFEPPSVDNNVPKFAGTKTLAFGALDRMVPSRIGLVMTAYDSDSNSAWEGFVKALGGDIKAIGNAGLAALPGLQQFAAPGAALAGITALVEKGLVNVPDRVSEDVPILDTVFEIPWFRKKGSPSTWRARKWVYFSLDAKPAWYLAQYFIELSIEPRSYNLASRQLFETGGSWEPRGTPRSPSPQRSA
jgi:hypothetical protein